MMEEQKTADLLADVLWWLKGYLAASDEYNSGSGSAFGNIERNRREIVSFPALDLTEYTRIRLDQVAEIQAETAKSRREAAPPQTAAGLRLAFMFPEYNRVRNCGRVWREYLLENPGGSTETYWQQTRCKQRAP
jgi:hypothetical protein